MKETIIIILSFACIGIALSIFAVLWFLKKKDQIDSTKLKDVKNDNDQSEVSDFMDIIKFKDNVDSVPSKSIEVNSQERVKTTAVTKVESTEEKMIKNLKMLYKKKIIFNNIVDELSDDVFVCFGLVLHYLNFHMTDEEFKNFSKLKVNSFLDCFTGAKNDENKYKTYIKDIGKIALRDLRNSMETKKCLEENDYYNGLFKHDFRSGNGLKHIELSNKITSTYKGYKEILEKKVDYSLDDKQEVPLTSYILFHIYCNM